MDCHQREPLSSEPIELNVAALYFSEEPSWVPVHNRKAKENDQVAVISVLLLGLAGFILLDLWREAVGIVFGNLITWTAATEDVIWLDVPYVQCSATVEPCVQLMLRLPGGDRTISEQCEPTSQSEEVATPESLYTEELMRLSRLVPPFNVTEKGVVTMLEEEGSSRCLDSLCELLSYRIRAGDM